MEDATNMSGPTGPSPMDMVKGPSIGLLVTGILGIVAQVIGLVVNLLNIGVAASEGGEQAAVGILGGGTGIVFNIIGTIIGIVIILGALKMQKLQSFGFAMTASILAMIPCISPCCLLGLPFGIWALVVLNKPEVKGAFTD